ncbi:MAG: ABC transporter permease, partial [Deinococcus sp.]|nr:ABC transporter permease [Deinococcus sp.]
PFGLRLRAVGEHPAAADSLGVNVFLMRYIGVTMSGVLGGMAGAFLSISQINQFIRNMSAGRGYIALAALIVGKWHPLGAAGAALLFGFAEAFQIRIGGLGLLPPQIPGMLPYLVTIVVVGGFVGRAIPPAAAGRPYDPGHD